MGSGHIITVFGAKGVGAKGGVGKSVLATNLAIALAQETGQRVALADLHLLCGDVGVLLDLPRERSIGDLVMSGRQVDNDTVKTCLHAHDTGIMVLQSPIRPANWRDISAKHVEEIVSVLFEAHDYVVLDTGGTPFNEIMAEALKLARMILLVTSTHEARLNDTRLLIDAMRLWGFNVGRLKLVLVATNDATEVEIEDVERNLGLRVACSVPYDHNISAATQLGTPLVYSHPDSELAQSITRLARDLAWPHDIVSGPKPFGSRTMAAKLLNLIWNERYAQRINEMVSGWTGFLLLDTGIAEVPHAVAYWGPRRQVLYHAFRLAEDAEASWAEMAQASAAHNYEAVLTNMTLAKDGNGDAAARTSR